MSSIKARGSTSSTLSGDSVLDNPCWGDPQHCSLSHLLTLIQRETQILLESPDYILLNKPADLRMDGEYPSSVFKLLTFWYPPPSLQGLKEETLLDQLQSFHNHSQIGDNELRPCHQLDYATSGVLLMARSAPAATWASSRFEHRQVQKTYLAILHGHLTTSTLADNNLPIIPQDKVNTFLQQQETTYRKRQKKTRKDTFQGYQPSNAFLQIYKGRYARRRQQQQHTNKKRKRNEKLTPEQWDQVDAALQLSTEHQAQLAQLSFREIKKQPTLLQGLTRATDCYNNFLREVLHRPQDDDINQNHLPPLFRVQEEDNSFYIYLAVAQVDHEFAMRIPVAHEWLETTTTDTPKLNFKVALTKCHIVHTTHLRGHPVTKVRLEPRTGRRHQLRIHTAFAGHPIVGDQTYEGPKEKNPPNLSSRMCLHAYTLGLPLPKKNGKDAVNVKNDNNHHDPQLQITAPDPFPISQEGDLTIASM
ncbi:pseudouridylate synthase domain-containing protein 1 [Seminavis robusta]|uniref:Pseudouridylate synthase domain-containing protein 1 n=1 Tax=Seminavis robusta TaxID=568900 RepID=A0A9N8HGG5_9STRA|nr:pseudouridylate synthase domain-containing protein 1 [Seminavis robusta]|eukprot:Sro508_g156740.1 pseudouridylate synthase domain-containing protein 1 (475) ;mRNA; r:25274-26698